MGLNAKVVVISEEPGFCARAEVLAKTFQAEFEKYSNDESYSEGVAQHDRLDFVIISAIHVKSQQDAVGYVQVAKFVAPKASVVVVVNRKVNAETTAFIKKSGASAILLEDEYLNQSKIEFIYGQNAFGDMVPIKASELVAGVPITFGLVHILPLNRKILPVVRVGDVLDEGKLAKLVSVGEFYLKRDELQNYTDFVSQNVDRSAKGLKGRCRAQYLNLTVTYKSLVNLLTDRSEASSFKSGKALIDKCSEVAKNLVTSLSDSGEAWDVVNLSAASDFTPLDRAPAIAAYAGIASLLTGVGSPDQVMVAAMLADIGLLELSPEGAQKLLKEGAAGVDKDPDRQIYRQHPVLSLNCCLERKLPIPEKLKEVMLCTHEKPNGKGFPVGQVNKLPAEAQLIRFCEKLDQSARVEIGRSRENPNAIRLELISAELKSMSGDFSPELMQKLKNI